jgi:hypothetical protein
MYANQGAGAFAVEVEIADMKLEPGSLDLFLIRRIERAGQAKLSIIGDL